MSSASTTRLHTLLLSGMTCGACAQTVQKQLLKIGLLDARVDFVSGEASFTLPDSSLLPSIVSQVEALGYPVIAPGTSPRGWRNLSIYQKFLISLLGSVPLLLHMFLPFPLLHDPFMQCLLASPVFILGLQHFGRSALGSLKTGSANMDVLIVIGISSAYLYSMVGLIAGFGPDFLFFETSATIVSFVLLGNLLEHRATKRTTSAIEELARLEPKEAKIVFKRLGMEEMHIVPVSELTVGVMLLANSGDRIPVDGVVEWGSAAVDESHITGESAARPKSCGDAVIAGSTVIDGAIKFRATAVGNDTTLASVIRMVRRAHASRPEIQRMGDLVSSYFVPAVVLFAVGALIVNIAVAGLPFGQALLRAIAVLVIACPCAMGLATPTAVMVGIAQAARRGILIKGGDILERLARIRRIVFDKTGTLTAGKFIVRNLTVHCGSEELVAAAIVGLEQHSSHPLAKSLVAAFPQAQAASFKHIEEMKGLGMFGIDSDGNNYYLGSRAFLLQRGVAPAFIASDEPTTGALPDLYLVRNQDLVATISIDDQTRPGAKELVGALQRAGIRTAILSGDRTSRVRSVAEQLGIDEFRAEQLPEHKLSTLEEFERECPSAFIGDGINDAPSLSRSSVGISFSDATHVAVQASHVVLIDGDLLRIREAISVSRATLKIIKQNLFWAFFYNAAAIPFAAAGFLTPSLAALAMGLSDVIVIANSLRLRSSWAFRQV